MKEVLDALPKAIREIKNLHAVPMPRPEYFESGLGRLRKFLDETVDVMNAAVPPTVSEEPTIEEVLESYDMPPLKTLSKADREHLSWSELQDKILGANRTES